MSDLLKAQHQLAKVHEMRKELRRLDAVLTKLDYRLGFEVKKLEQGSYADANSFSLFEPLKGWLNSMIESYIAIVYARDANIGRLYTSDVQTFMQNQRDREESNVTREQAAFWREREKGR